MKTLRAAAVALFVLGLLAGGVNAKPVQVWEDAANDSGLARDGGPITGSEQSGFDLVGGTIDRVKKDLVFTAEHSVVPPSGHIPEGFRFMWSFAVDGTSYRVTAKSAEIGKPNPINQANMDQVGQVYTDGFFRLEGNCGVTAAVATLSFVDCEALAYIEGAFDPAAKTLTFNVPMNLVKAKKGSEITSGGGDAATLCYAGAVCWTSHAAERSSDRTVVDAAIITGTYKVK